MNFNPHVLLLFTNAFLTTALSVVIVGAILIREYRPAILRLKREQAEGKASPGGSRRQASPDQASSKSAPQDAGH